MSENIQSSGANDDLFSLIDQILNNPSGDILAGSSTVTNESMHGSSWNPNTDELVEVAPSLQSIPQWEQGILQEVDESFENTSSTGCSLEVPEPKQGLPCPPPPRKALRTKPDLKGVSPPQRQKQARVFVSPKNKKNNQKQAKAQARKERNACAAKRRRKAKKDAREKLRMEAEKLRQQQVESNRGIAELNRRVADLRREIFETKVLKATIDALTGMLEPWMRLHLGLATTLPQALGGPVTFGLGPGFYGPGESEETDRANAESVAEADPNADGDPDPDAPNSSH